MKRHKPPLLKSRSLAKPTNVFSCNHGSTTCKTFCNISYPLYIHNIHIQHTSVSGLLLPRLVAFRVGSDHWSPVFVEYPIRTSIYSPAKIQQ